MKNLPHSLNFLPLIAGALLAGSLSAHAATILANDNFSLSTGSGVGTVNNTQSTGVGTYSTIQGSNGMTVTTQAGLGSGNVLSFANNANTYYRAFNGVSEGGSAPFSLSSLSTGSTLKLSFNIYFVGTLSTASDNFSFGFVNTAANAGAGYSVLYVNADLSGTTPAERPSEFRYRTNSFNMSDNVASTSVGTFTEPVTATNTSYLFALDVTRLSNGYQIDYYRDNSLVNSLSLTGGSFLTSAAIQDITGIAFRHSSAPGVTTYLDNVSVTVIPEPQALGLLALGVAGVTLRRDRRARPTLK